jgi:DNA-binding MarR family transcriptional regulator
MDLEKLRGAFEKIKDEISFLKSELSFLKKDVEILGKDSIEAQKTANNNELLLNELNQKLSELNESLKLYINSNTPTTDFQHSNTYSSKFEGIKPYILSSNGNEGVPTLPQQTNTQSNTYPTDDFMNKIQQEVKPDLVPEMPKISIKELVASMKTDLKIKFKALTKQEFHVFSVLFSLEQELNRPLSYKDLAIKANLTESTIRDYIGRLIEKGIPISKERVNNRDILIRVNEDLRNIASLDSLSRIKSDKYL